MPPWLGFGPSSTFSTFISACPPYHLSRAASTLDTNVQRVLAGMRRHKYVEPHRLTLAIVHSSTHLLYNVHFTYYHGTLHYGMLHNCTALTSFMDYNISCRDQEGPCSSTNQIIKIVLKHRMPTLVNSTFW
eukprot:780527-Amphidinium_carterae.4